jgi:phosphatidylserine/phosphatidylglycerophosphate/cardiolipin synthase-like enzyme
MTNSSLFDEKTFYKQFDRDLRDAKSEVVIESPFITTLRMNKLASILKKLVDRGIKVYVITRDPKEHQPPYIEQSEIEIRHFEQIGVQVLICLGNHHRKLAIIDRRILWEGSLNILSQIKSREIMRRIDDKKSAEEMFSFLKLEKFI